MTLTEPLTEVEAAELLNSLDGAQRDFVRRLLFERDSRKELDDALRSLKSHTECILWDQDTLYTLVLRVVQAYKKART